MLLDAIERFIKQQIQIYPRLHEWLGDWSPDHETQILIDPEGLYPIAKETIDGKVYEVISHEGKPLYWQDDEGYEHRNIRIPFGAMTDNPRFSDRKVIGNIYEHWQYLGCSGWSWKQQKSMYVGYDFDSIANHSGGLQPHQLQEVLNRALELPYVQARTSKSGQGFHLIVRLKPWIPTRSHCEHAALAQDVLNRMSRDCGFSFHDAADCCGLILWHWSKNLHHDGLRNIRHDGLGPSETKEDEKREA